jgi:hypothetical protein
VNTLLRLLAKEPVMLGKVLLAWTTIPITLSSLDDAAKALLIGAVTITVGWGERLLSTPVAAVEEKVQAGYDAAIADVSSLIKPPPIP